MPDTNRFYDIYFIYHPDNIDFVRHLAAQLSGRDISCWFDEEEFGDNDEDRQQLLDGVLRSYTVAMIMTPSSAESQLCNTLVESAVNNSKRFVTLIVDDDIAVDVHPAIAKNAYIFFREQDVFEFSIATLLGLLPADAHLRFHTELLVNAHRWNQNQRAVEFLLEQERVDEARQWLAGGAQRSPKPSQLQVEYIHASRRKKPAKNRGISRYAALGIVVVIATAALLLLLQNVTANNIAATATADYRAISASQTQRAMSFAATATAQSNSSALLLANLAATSDLIAAGIRQTADFEAQQATLQAGVTLTAEARITRQAANLRATELARLDRQIAAQRVIDAAERALANGDYELAMALAWDVADTLEKPAGAIRILQQAYALRPALVLDEVSIIHMQAGGRLFALVPRDFEQVRVYDSASMAQLYEIDDHDAAITAITFSRDGQLLISAAQDGEVVIRDSETGAAIHRLQHHQGPVSAIAVSHAGDKLYSAGQDPLLVAWDIESGSELASYSAEASDAQAPRDLLVTADDTRIISWTEEGGKAVMGQWSAETLELLTADSGGRVYLGYDKGGSIGYSGGRSLPAYAGDPNTGDLILWELNTGQQLARLEEGFNWSLLSGGRIASATDSLLFISFGPESALLAVQDSSGGQRAVLVDRDDGTLRATFESEIAARITSAHFLDQQTILSATREQELVLWSALDGSLIREIGRAPDPLEHVMVSGDGSVVLGQAQNGSVYLWHVDAGASRALREIENAVEGTALSQSGSTLLVARENGTLLLDIADGTTLLQIEESNLSRMNDKGSHFAIAQDEGVHVYDASSGEQTMSWEVNIAEISELHLAPTGETLLIEASAGDLWLLTSERETPQQLITGGLGAPVLVRFAADANAILTLHPERVLLWDGETGAALQAFPLGVPNDFPAEQRFRAAINPAGDKLYFFVLLQNNLAGLTAIALDDGSVRRLTFVNIADGELSPDGSTLALAYLNGSVEIVDTDFGDELHGLGASDFALRMPIFHAGSERLYAAAGSYLLVWDLPSGAIEQSFEHASAVSDYWISRTGEFVLSEDSEGSFRLWQVETLEMILRRIEADYAPRELSCAEREQYHALPLCE